MGKVGNSKYLGEKLVVGSLAVSSREVLGFELHFKKGLELRNQRDRRSGSGCSRELVQWQLMDPSDRRGNGERRENKKWQDWAGM